MARTAPSPAAFDAARAAFEALPEADRKAFQEALTWTSGYSGVPDGTFGRQTFEAIASLQQSAGKPPTGILSPFDRKAVVDAAQKAKDLVGFAVVDDPRSGVRIGVPARVLPKQETNSNGGSRWQSPDGKVTLDTRTAPPDATLQSLFDRNVAIQSPGRVVTYKVFRPEFFVIAGETPTGKFYTRYAAGPNGLRGFSIGYDKAVAPQVDRFVVAIANSFIPFPPPAAPAAVAQAPAPAAPAPVPPAAQARLIGTGLVVGPRRVVTTAAVEACRDLRVLGLRPQQTKGKDVYLLDFAEDLKARPARLVPVPMKEGSALLVLAFADENGTPVLVAAPGSASTSATVSAALQPGASGAPVLDANRAMVGVVGPVASDQRRIAGVVPLSSHRVIPIGDVLKAFPEIVPNGEHAPADRTSAADAVASLRSALVPVMCGPEVR